MVVAVATGVANGHARLLGVLLALLHQLAAAILGERGERQADDRAVVVRRDAQVAFHDGVLDGAQDALVPRLDDQHVRVGRLHAGHLVDGRGNAVVVHLDAVEHHGVGAARANGAEGVVQAVHGALHLLLGFKHDLVDHFGSFPFLRQP